MIRMMARAFLLGAFVWLAIGAKDEASMPLAAMSGVMLGFLCIALESDR